MTEAADAQWHAEVSTQLATLQTEMARLTATLTEDRKRREPSRRAWVLAYLLLCCSGVLVLIGISSGLVASTSAALASTYQTLARTDLSRSLQAIEPVTSLANRKGAAWVLDHATKTTVDAGAVLGWMLTQWLTPYPRRNSGAEGRANLPATSGRKTSPG